MHFILLQHLLAMLLFPLLKIETLNVSITKRGT